MTADSTVPVTPGAPVPATGGSTRLFAALLIGALVSLTLGLFGRFHSPTGIAVDIAGFSSTQSVKVWLVTLATLFALAQLFSALVMYGKFPGITAPTWIGTLHRWSGRVAFLLTVPIVMHCLYALGFQTYSTRVLIHSLLGCVFFGAFTVKMLVLTKRGLAGWVLPLFGGAVFTALIGLWLSSALWFFTTNGVKF